MLTRYTKVVLIALLSVAPVAMAAETDSQIVPFSGIPNLTDTLTFDQFDDNGGLYTLQAVEVKLSLNVSGGQLILDNDGELAAAGNFEFGATADLSSADVSLINALNQPIPGTASALTTGSFSLDGNVGDVSGDYDPAAPDGAAFNGNAASDLTTDFVGSSYFTAGNTGFVGAGTFDILIGVDQWQDYGAVGGIEYAVTPVTSCGCVEIIYTYTPEPASLALLGLGSLLFRRRRTA